MAVLPTHCLLYRDEDTAPYECDGLSAYRRLPLAVALPETESQVQRIVQICRRMEVPIVRARARACRAARCRWRSASLSLARFTRIVEVDPYARTATVQPGVRNLAISEAAAPYGLYYAPDPSSQIACTIGGNVAENSGGVHCLKYGLTVHNVMRVRAVTIDGEIVEFGSLALDMPGLDLLAVMIGSEGMFAIVTEVTVKLIPKPQTAQLVMASFDDVVKGGEAVAAIIASGIIPAARNDGQAGHAGRRVLHACRLRPRREGDPAVRIGRHAGGSRGRDRADDGRAARAWRDAHPGIAQRERAAALLVGPQERVPGRRPYFARLLLHGRHRAAPRDRPAARAHRAARNALRLRCINVFHAGDGNMHPLILYNANDPDELHRAEQFGAEILECCVEFGGSVTGEHGVGIEKLNSMCVQFSPQERDAFFAVKRAFDPAGC